MTKTKTKRERSPHIPDDMQLVPTTRWWARVGVANRADGGQGAPLPPEDQLRWVFYLPAVVRNDDAGPARHWQAKIKVEVDGKVKNIARAAYATREEAARVADRMRLAVDPTTRELNYPDSVAETWKLPDPFTPAARRRIEFSNPDLHGTDHGYNQGCRCDRSQNGGKPGCFDRHSARMKELAAKSPRARPERHASPAQANRAYINGEALRVARETAGWSRRALSSQIGGANNLIMKLEVGQQESIPTERARLLRLWLLDVLPAAGIDETLTRDMVDAVFAP